jgi:hypothetical protein
MGKPKIKNTKIPWLFLEKRFFKEIRKEEK